MKKIYIVIIIIAIYLLSGCFETVVEEETGIGAAELGWSGEFDSISIEPEIFDQLQEKYPDAIYDDCVVVRGFILDFFEYSNLETLKDKIKEISDNPQRYAQYFFINKDDAVINTCIENNGEFKNNYYSDGLYLGQDVSYVYRCWDDLKSYIDLTQIECVLYSNSLTGVEFMLIMTHTNSWVLFTTDGAFRKEDGTLYGYKDARYLVPLDKFINFAKATLDKFASEQFKTGVSHEDTKQIRQYLIYEGDRIIFDSSTKD